MKKGNYFTGSLACQSLCDCSLCDLPIEVQTAKTEEKLPNKSKNNTLKKILEKVSETVAA